MPYPNIEKSAFLPHTYVGYSGGNVWRIKKTGRIFRAMLSNPAQGVAGETFTRNTLAAVSYELQRRADLMQAAKGLSAVE